MGTASSCFGAVPLLAHAPIPGPELSGWDKCSQENVFQCLEFLMEVHMEDQRGGACSRLAKSYDVEVADPKSGRANVVHVSDVGLELQTVYALLSKEKKKRGKLKPPSDVRREAVLCAIHSKLLKMSKLICTEELEVEFINSQLEVPYTIHQLVAVRDVFEDINVSQSGAIALPELLRWISRRQSSVALSTFHFLFMELAPTDVPREQNFIEFLVAVDSFCTLNEEGLTNMVFNGLSDCVDYVGQPAIDITQLPARFSGGPDLFEQGMGMTLVKAIARLYSKRLEADELQPHSDGDIDLLNREQFDRLINSHSHLLDQLFALHQVLRRTTLGHRAWNQRRRDLAKARAANGTRNVANTKRPRYFLKPPREVEKVYRVKNVRRHSNLRLQLGGSSGSGVSPPLSHRSNRSGRSARSTRSRRRNDRSRRESRASRSARDVRSKVESPGRHGAFTMPHTPQSVSLNGGSNSDSNGSANSLAAHQAVPSHLNSLGDEATAEFASFLRETQSWSHPQRTDRSGRSTSRTTLSRRGSERNQGDRRRSTRAGTREGRFSAMVQSAHHARALQEAAKVKEEQRRREAEHAAAAAAKEAEAERQRRAVVAAQASMGLSSMGSMYGAGMMNPPVNPYVNSFGSMYNMPAMAPVPAQPQWGAGAPYAVAQSTPMSPSYAAHTPMSARGNARARATSLEHDHAAFDAGAFPPPPPGVPSLNLMGGSSRNGSGHLMGPPGPSPGFVPRTLSYR